MSLQQKIKAVRISFRTALDSLTSDKNAIEELRSKYLGRKGEIASLFSQMVTADPEEKPLLGKALNQLKNDCSVSFEKKVRGFEKPVGYSTSSGMDYTLPGIHFPVGSLHPLQQILDEIKDVFISIGFSIAYGPEIDDDFHNFQALNIPKHHPARDMQDTFFIDKNIVLRTHTSNVQIHLMENNNPPLRYIVPGRVYRNEAISFKSYCLFHQVEGLYVDKHVSFSEMKGMLEFFVKRIFGRNVKIRFRPSYFPFTEPSAEVDVWDETRDQWMEILGCGSVDPAVFENVGYDPEIWQGYAFGMGIERIAMLKYKIADIRHFYQNDVRFLSQF